MRGFASAGCVVREAAHSKGSQACSTATPDRYEILLLLLGELMHRRGVRQTGKAQGLRAGAGLRCWLDTPLVCGAGVGLLLGEPEESQWVVAEVPKEPLTHPRCCPSSLHPRIKLRTEFSIRF